MHPTSRTMEGYAETFLYGAIEVNAEGVRKVNEALYWSNDRTRVTLQQPKKDGGGDNDEEEILLDNFFDEGSEADDVIAAFDEIRGDDDITTMRNAMEVIGIPISVKALQFACWKRAPKMP